MTDHLKIRIWHLETKITQEQVAREAGLSQSVVSLVINGHRKNKKVVEAYKRLGCPAEYFE